MPEHGTRAVVLQDRLGSFVRQAVYSRNRAGNSFRRVYMEWLSLRFPAQLYELDLVIVAERIRAA